MSAHNLENALEWPTHHSSSAIVYDRPLQQRGVHSHLRDQPRAIEAGTIDTQLLCVASAQQIVWLQVKPFEQRSQLVHRQGIAGVFTIGEFHIIGVEQGDRLATGASSLFAD
jgi:hypothetical protein